MISETMKQDFYNTVVHKNSVHNFVGNSPLKSSLLETPIGLMLAISDDHALYLLEFIDGRGLEREIANLCRVTKSTIISSDSAPIQSIMVELAAYFNGDLKEFKTPYYFLGSTFQKSVWGALKNISYGQTKSYTNQAEAIGNKSACRAVANANGANQLAIIIPCHRIINSNGKLGGYGGGIARKQWLLDFERQQNDK